MSDGLEGEFHLIQPTTGVAAEIGANDGEVFHLFRLQALELESGTGERVPVDETLRSNLFMIIKHYQAQKKKTHSPKIFARADFLVDHDLLYMCLRTHISEHSIALELLGGESIVRFFDGAG